MRLPVIRSLVIVSTTGLAIAALAGCSSSGSSASPSAPSEPSAPPAPTQTNASPIPTGPLPTSIVLNTNQGPVTITPDPAAPKTAETIGALARLGYYNNTPCHRLTGNPYELFVLQCGDPTGKGTGGPGFKFADENLPTDGTGVYPMGTVAMANAGPNTNGSQFFLVYKDSQLGPNYSVWGHITKGLPVVEKVAKAGSTPVGDGTPNLETNIETVTVTPAG